MTRPKATFRKYVAIQREDFDRISITIGVEMPAMIKLGSITMSRWRAAKVALLILNAAAAPTPAGGWLARRRLSKLRIDL